MSITEDEFITWREHPVTQHIFDTVLYGQVREAKKAWVAMAWEKGNLCPVTRAAYRERAKLAEQLIALQYHDLDLEGSID